MPGIDFNQLPRILNQMLPKYVGKGRGKALINETTERDIGSIGALLNKAKVKWDGGTYWQEKLQFQPAQVGKWAGVGEKLVLGGTKGISLTQWPRRFFRFAHFIDFSEIDNQKDEETIIHDVVMQAKEDVAISVIQALRDAFDAPDGNYLHDGVENFLIMFGWRHLLTIDGLHITGDSTKSVGGINPSTQTAYRNPYINPVAAADGRATIKNVMQLRKALERMLRMLSYQSLESWGSLSSAVKGVPKENPDGPGDAGDEYVGMCDTATHDDFREVVFDRMDNVGRDQNLPAPVYKGIKFRENTRMGVDPTYGWGFDSSGAPLWADRGGAYASGQWKGYGEMVVFNTNRLKLLYHGDHFPANYGAYKPEGMAGTAFEGDIWVQLALDSRRRCGGYIGPYQLLDNN